MATAEGVEVFEDTIDQVSSDLHGRILLKREQKKALIDLLLKKDVLAVLPTGLGKSLIYQYFVLAKAKQRVHQGSVCASALIICPLLSIVDDQIKEAKYLGITACRLKDFLEEETSKVDFTVTQLAHIMKYMSFSYVKTNNLSVMVLTNFAKSREISGQNRERWQV